VLGGVGLVVSAHSGYREEAVGYLAYVAGEECQKGLYFESGGQPGHRAAWEDRGVNERSSGFFENTLRTMDLAYLRPRYAGFPTFQKKAGERIHRFLQDGGDCREAVEDLNRLHGEARAISLG
jgi:multiple sugar transport system substrate-binding protein